MTDATERDSDLLERDDLRWLDVLLAENLGAPMSARSAPAVGRAPPQRWSRWLAAALLLLGLSVVIGVLLSRRLGGVSNSAAATEQEPRETARPLDIGVLQSVAARADWFRQVARVRVQQLGGSALDPTPVPGAETVIQQHDRVAGLGDGVLELIGPATYLLGWDGPLGFDCRLVFEGNDGCFVQALLRLRDDPMVLLFPGGIRNIPPGPFLDELRRLHTTVPQPASQPASSRANCAIARANCTRE
jgi:hypothetical protein